MLNSYACLVVARFSSSDSLSRAASERCINAGMSRVSLVLKSGFIACGMYSLFFIIFRGITNKIVAANNEAYCHFGWSNRIYPTTNSY